MKHPRNPSKPRRTTVRRDAPKTVLAVIPARAGSKRVPGKNSKLLAGKPLISYSLAAAQKARTITDSVVTTNDARVATIARRAGVTVIDRPAALAQDGTPALPVIEHAVLTFEKQTGKHVDIVVYLQPTSPLRTAADIDDTVNLVLAGAHSAETFSARHDHPSYAFTLDAKGNAKALDPRNVTKSLSLLPPRFFENGAVYAVRRDVLLTKHTLYGTTHKGIVLPPERSLDIDEPIDFIIAEAIIRGA